MEPNREQIEIAKIDITEILATARSIKEAERRMSDLVGQQVKLEVISQRGKSAIAWVFMTQLLGARIIRKTGHAIIGVRFLDDDAS